jgi:hypothetical protein
LKLSEGQIGARAGVVWGVIGDRLEELMGWLGVGMVVARKLQNCPCGEDLSSPAKDKEKYNKTIIKIILIIKQIINK